MRLLLLACAMLFVAQHAFASKARVEALGLRSWGSNYVESDRLIFVNPANINDYNNYVVAEIGTQNSTTTSGTSTGAESDKETQENGEGGVFIKGRAFNYGIYLGNESNDAYILKALTGVATVTRPMLNRWEVFVGKDGAIKWGAGVWFANGSDEQSLDGTQLKQTSLGFKIGVKGKKYRLGLVQGLIEKAEGSISSTIGTNTKFNGKFMSMVNGGYDLTDQLTIIFESIRTTGEVTGSSIANLNGKITMDNHFVGAGYKIHQSKDVKVFSDLTLRYVNFDWDTVAHRNQVNTLMVGAGSSLDAALTASGLAGTQLYIPINIAAEVKAASWLTFRGAITQRLWGYDKEVGGAKATKIQGRTISAGMTLKFKNLDVDGLLKDRGNSQIGSNDLMSRIAATYYF